MSTKKSVSRKSAEVRVNEKPLRPVIGVPLERTLAHADKVIWSFISIAQQGFPFIQVGYGRTDLVRNRMAIHLLQSDFTHLIMLDADHVHPYDIVQRLMRHFAVNPNLKVVGGLNFRRGEPYDPCAFLKGDDGKFYAMSEWEPGLIKVDAIGTGCIAIAREVFEQMEPPWFFNDYSRVMEDVWPGEDMGFCQKCADLGIGLWVDTTTTSPHLIDGYVDEESYRQYNADHDIVSVPVADLHGKAG